MSIFKRSIFWAAAIFFCFAQMIVVQAIMAPQIYFTGDPVIETVDLAAGNKVAGTVEIWNYENSTMSDLVFNYQLLAGEDNGVPTELIDNSQKGEIFSLSAGQKVVKNIEYLLPNNIESGNYTLRIQITNARGEELAWADKVISVGGNGKFLTIENGVIVSKTARNSRPPRECIMNRARSRRSNSKCKRNSGSTITAVPSVVTYNRNVGSNMSARKTKIPS